MRILKANPEHWTSPRKMYFKRLFNATPKWLSKDQLNQFHAVYRAASRMRKHGRNVHVDHIVPLNGKYVCGLNVPWNLQIVDYGVNLCKSNHKWPDMPNEPGALDLDQPPQQLELCV